MWYTWTNTNHMAANRQGMNQERPAWLFWGDDEYAVELAARETVDRLVPAAEQVFRLESVDARQDASVRAEAAIVQCLAALQSASLLGDTKVVWFRDATFLGDSKTGSTEGVKKRLKSLAELVVKGFPPGIVLVVSAGPVDRRTALFKAFEQSGNVREFPLADKPKMAAQQAADKLRAAFKASGLDEPGEDVIAELFDRVGPDSRQIMTEVEKLNLYLGRRRHVTFDDIRAIVSSTRNSLIWDFEDALGRREVALCLKVFRQLVYQKEEPIRLVMSIERRIRDLLLYRELLDNRWVVPSSGYGNPGWREMPPEIDAVLKNSGDRDPRSTHPFRAAKLLEQAAYYSRRELQAAQQIVLAAHEQLVSSSAPGPMLLELALMRIMRRRAAAPATLPIQAKRA